MALTKIPASLLDTASGINGLIYPTSDGTAGQYLKTDGSGNLAFATVTTYTDSDVETYLDGGTSTPTFASATVSGALTVTGDLNITGDINSYNVTDLDVTDQTITLGAGQIEANSGGSGIIVDGSGASILWDETNDTFDFNKGLTTTGNVGIGTTTPGSFSVNASNLVVGSGSGTEGITISSGTAAYGVIYFADGTTGSAAYAGNINYNHADNSMRFGTAGSTTDVAIDSSGNVGIGTTSPTSKLHVQGTSYFFDQSIFGDKVGIGTTGPSAPLDVVTNSTVYAAEFTQSNTSNGDGVLVMVGSTAAADYALTVRSDAGNTSVLAAKADGKVGIGTFSPAQDLHIQSTDPTLVLAQSGSVNNANSGRILFAESPSYTTNNAHFEIKYDGAASPNHLYFGSPLDGTTNLFVVARTGKVGIGTASPGADLHIGGQEASPGGTAGTVDRLHIQPYSNTGGPYKFIARTVSGSSDFLDMYYGSNHIISYGLDGKVGIGTTTPSELLEVRKDNSNAIIKVQTGGGYDARLILDAPAASGAQSQIFFDASGTTAGSIQYTHNSGGTNFMTFGTGGSNTERMRIDSSGAVTMPSQPSFLVYPTANAFNQPTGANVIIMASEAHDQGANYNTTNGRFTAPVTGRYLNILNLALNANTYGLPYLGIGVRKNGTGAVYWGGWAFKGNGGANSTASHYAQATSVIILELAANDYLECYIEVAGTISTLGGSDGAYTRWSGQLLS